MHLARVISPILLFLLTLFVFSWVPGSAQAPPPELPAELDPISRECMSCHDGSSGYHINLCFLSQLGTACGSHIVSADYAELAARKNDLNPVSSLPAELVLHEGLITCATCHGEEPHLGESLVLRYDNSDLCRACHKK